MSAGLPPPRVPTNAELLSSAQRASSGRETTVEIARNIPTSYDSSGPTPTLTLTPRGEITTLLDLTNRDLQENDLFPLTATETWFTRDTERRVIPFAPVIQEIPIRGPAAFGQRFSFDLGSLMVGDLLFGTVLQIHLDHWLDAQTQLLLAAGRITYADPGLAWEYANSLGTSIIAQAELEIDGKTIETLDGDFINVFANLFPDYNTQVGVAYDHLGRISTTRLMAQTQPRLWPTEEGILHCVLPFFFGRQQRHQEALPMIAVKEGLTRIHITLRPFEDCVRQLRGFRDSCEAVPLALPFQFTSRVGGPPRSVTSSAVPPSFKSVQLLTYGALLDGEYRQKMLRDPFEILHRGVQTFSFDEPLKYTVGRTEADTIRIQLPLEANHPVEELIWFVRRKGVGANNAWTNYTGVLEEEWPAAPAAAARAAAQPLLVRAALQLNGITVCDADEQYYRQLIANAHKGGAAAYNNFLYGYPFARRPGEHQPSGTANASKLGSLRLTLDIRPPGGILDAAWEVKVFCVALNWLRFENGLANPMFTD